MKVERKPNRKQKMEMELEMEFGTERKHTYIHMEMAEGTIHL